MRESRAYLFVSIFLLSLSVICLELLLGRVLSLKTWSHLVYIVISFALLGYGVGSTLYLLIRERVDRLSERRVVEAGMLAFGVLGVASLYLLSPLQLLIDMSKGSEMILKLAAACLLTGGPFVAAGFLISYMFTVASEASGRLYFWDLVGAGLGAVAFFPLLTWSGPHYAVLGLSAVLVLFAAGSWALDKRGAAGWGGLAGAAALVAVCLFALPEPDYKGPKKWGFEYVTQAFRKSQYVHLKSGWHALGRTDLFRIVDPEARAQLYRNNGTFQVNLRKVPEFAYFATNFRSGCPVYSLPGDPKAAMALSEPKTQAMEYPYLLVDRPRVMVIGPGGGRDIYMALTNGASEVVGAEINPFTHAAMAKGGAAYDYSGRLYDWDGVRVHNVDGRHQVKVEPEGSFDLVVLNGVDTFSALASGAYAFAENYLYTREAFLDYFRILKPDGVLNLNRLYYLDMPRETFRLFVMASDALKRVGVERPWEHVMVGYHEMWAMVVVRKTPFTVEEQREVWEHFKRVGVDPIYFPGGEGIPEGNKHFHDFARALKDGTEADYIRDYPYDVSVVRDDSPFFYKYYRLFSARDKRISHIAYGFTAFKVQLLILIESVVFSVLFLAVPLLIFKSRGMRGLPAGGKLPFVTYVSCLGAGFIFIEISLMQKLTLLLGRPMYSISVTLASILIFTGVGAYLIPRGRKLAGSTPRLLGLASAGVALCVLLLLAAGGLINTAVGWPFALRVALACVILLPLGILLGMFFPSVLALIGKDYPECVPWAWGINAGFTVVGSVLSIFAAQFMGFSKILLVSALIYLLAGWSFGRLHAAIAPRGSGA